MPTLEWGKGADSHGSILDMEKNAGGKEERPGEKRITQENKFAREDNDP